MTRNRFLCKIALHSIKKEATTPALGGMIGAASLGAQIIDISSGTGGILGVIAGVCLIAKLEKTIRKRVFNLLDLILTPLLTILIEGSVPENAQLLMDCIHRGCRFMLVRP